MERYLNKYISLDLDKKIILLSGPRQAGKTTIAKSISSDSEYLNFDSSEHRLIFQEKSWDRGKSLLIFDELHKMKNWKQWLKGVYDTEGLNPPIIVTGSARLNTYRKVGDSLAGRYFPFRLHPLDIKEISTFLGKDKLDQAFEKLLNIGGFPEPFLEGSTAFYNRWRKTHLDIILRQDLVELETVSNIIQIETLIELLRKRVGSPISYSSLARDLSSNDKTVKRWLQLLENLFVIFRVTPFHKNVARSIQKAPKYYFFDNGQVVGDEGVRFENLLANALLKEIDFRSDCLGESWRLNYLRTKDGSEVDFCLTNEKEEQTLVEAKWKEDDPSKSLKTFHKKLSPTKSLQIVANLQRDKTFPEGIEVREAKKWLSQMKF